MRFVLRWGLSALLSRHQHNAEKKHASNLEGHSTQGPAKTHAGRVWTTASLRQFPILRPFHRRLLNRLDADSRREQSRRLPQFPCAQSSLERGVFGMHPLLIAARFGIFKEGRFLGKVLDEWTIDTQEFIRTKLPHLIVVAVIAFVLIRLLRMITHRMITVAEQHSVSPGR